MRSQVDRYRLRRGLFELLAWRFRLGNPIQPRLSPVVLLESPLYRTAHLTLTYPLSAPSFAPSTGLTWAIHDWSADIAMSCDILLAIVFHCCGGGLGTPSLRYIHRLQ